MLDRDDRKKSKHEFYRNLILVSLPAVISIVPDLIRLVLDKDEDDEKDSKDNAPSTPPPPDEAEAEDEEADSESFKSWQRRQRKK